MHHGRVTPDAGPLLLVSFGVGIVVGLTGMGGGALMTPALIFLGVPPTAAVANDLVAAAVTKSVGATVHWRRGSPDLRLAGLLTLGSVPTAFAGAWLVRALGSGAEQERLLRLAIGATLLLTATTFVLRVWVGLARGETAEPADTPPTPKPVRTVLLGAGGGLLVGVTSVGSGSLIMVCLLLLYPALAARRLVGTDLVQAIPLVVSAAISHVLVTGVQWAVLLPLLLGGMPGTYLGARLSSVVSPSLTRRGIAIVLTLTGLTLLGAPPLWVGAAGVALAVAGPVGWAGIRRAHGAPAFHRVDLRLLSARLGRAG